MSGASSGYAIGTPLGGPAREGPRVDVSDTHLKVAFVGFSREAGTVHYLYEESSVHADVPGKDLQGWGLGPRIESAEYWNSASRIRNRPVCCTRHSSVQVIFGLRGTVRSAVSLTLKVTPTLRGEATTLQPATIVLDLDPGASLQAGTLTLDGLLPDDVGEHELQLEWRSQTSGVRFLAGQSSADTERTEHTVFTVFGPPLRPDDHIADVLEKPTPADAAAGTISGTRRRLSHLMRLVSSAPKNGPASHPVATDEDFEDIWWRLHVGINETTGKPPYFNGAHMAWICPNGPGTEPELPAQDQWLLWVKTPEKAHWNDTSCIGHVQLAKTMLAAIGIPVLRAFVLPFTHRLPGGATREVSEGDLIRREKRGVKDRQEATLRVDGRPFTAHVVLVEKDGARPDWEEYEAVLMTRKGRLLPGGYTPSNMPPSFRTEKGFRSGIELLHWWTTTKRGSFERFMCWAFHNPEKGTLHYWDVDGTPYAARDFQKIFDRKKALPPPPLPKAE